MCRQRMFIFTTLTRSTVRRRLRVASEKQQIIGDMTEVSGVEEERRRGGARTTWFVAEPVPTVSGLSLR